MTSPASSPRAVPASTRASAPKRSSQWGSVERTHGWEPLRIEGELPVGLQATVLDVDVEPHDLAHYDRLLDEGDDDDQPS